MAKHAHASSARSCGYSHGLLIAEALYENVSRYAMEGRVLGTGEEENVIHVRMPVACLWSHWQGAGGPDLLSFAAITDEPPAEVAAASHDCSIIPIKPEAIPREHAKPRQ